ncbi:hypothetical protein SRB5_28600 [Streptomyces sp. RB5]|uniref:Uncharacterized protein n=1 Tax=Streptomyces smaragdinus TaxID=2585196 RepID=A0A7K0CGW5_9ACTN|nr:hypothetical protein [Streptomyces smaragdinus]MQY12721.1 hypothetical protein [Streptomyces smaragdinus]
MITEAALLESRSLRSGMSHRTDVLDKVKALVLMPDGVHASTQLVADYFEVSEPAVNNLFHRHREELQSCGLRILRGSDLQEYKDFKMKSFPESYPQPRSSLALWPRRAILCTGMLLRDSAVAQRVRTYLLDAEESTRRTRPSSGSPWSPGGRHYSLDQHVEDIVTATAERVLTPVMGELTQLNQRMAAQNEVVGAMSIRLADVQADVAGIRGDMAELREDVRADVGELRTEVSELRRDLTRHRHNPGRGGRGR